jgi:hypothetical protein
MGEEKRRVEILRNEKWVDYEFMDLKNGDIFRLFESTGEPVDYGRPWIATGSAYSNNGVGTVDCELWGESL